MDNKDIEIIKRIREGDTEVISDLRVKYYNTVKKFVYYYMYSNGEHVLKATEDDIEDLLHDSLYILLMKINNEDFVLTSKLSTFFHGIFKNLLKAYLKRKLSELQFRFYNSEYYDTEESFEFSYDKNIRKIAFDYYFEKLSKVCKRILKYYWTGYSAEKTAEMLGNTRKYITKRKYECQKRLGGF